MNPQKALLRLACLGGALALLGTFTSQSQAAPPAPRAAPVVLDGQGKYVVGRLNWLINKRMKGANGAPIGLKIVPGAKAGQGYFSEISITGSPAKIKRMYLTQLNLDAKNVKLDVPYLVNEHKIRTTQATTKLRAVVSDADITRMLAESKGTKDMGIKVNFLPTGNRLRVTGNLKYALLNGPVDGIGTLRNGADSKIYLDITSLKLRGTETPAFVKNWLSNKINPLIDYSEVPFSPPFKSFKIVGNKAFITT
jgi:hypothetical protein